MSMCRVFSCVLEEDVCYDQCIFLAKLYSPLPCFIPYSKSKCACYSRCFFTSYFCIPVPYNEKDIFWDVSSRRSYRSSSVQFSSVTQLCPTLCDPMNRSTPGLPVHHQLPEFTQSHIHRVSDAIQPSHPLLSPSPPAPNPSQHQSLFQWVNSSHEVAIVLEFQL